MQRYIALLRGINVGGHKKILMADLRKLINTLGYTNIRTYIQTGNIIFDSSTKEDNSTIALNIQDAILDTFGFEVPVMVRTAEEIHAIVKQNPYATEGKSDIDSLHLTLLDAKPTDENIAQLKAIDCHPDSFEIIDKSMYLYCVQKYSDTKLGNNIIEKKLKLRATTRNWKTTLKLLELANE